MIVLGSILLSIIVVLFIPQLIMTQEQTFKITCENGSKYTFNDSWQAQEKLNECFNKTQTYINFDNITFNNGIKLNSSIRTISR